LKGTKWYLATTKTKLFGKNEKGIAKTTEDEHTALANPANNNEDLI